MYQAMASAIRVCSAWPGRRSLNVFCAVRAQGTCGSSRKDRLIWVDNDLTKFSGGTPASTDSNLDGYPQDDGSQHVNFVDDSGHVHELYRSPDPAAQWVDNDLTKFANGTPANMAFSASPLDGYAQGDGSQHVNFIAGDGHVHELYDP
jgi:hypothetical protein